MKLPGRPDYTLRRRLTRVRRRVYSAAALKRSIALLGLLLAAGACGRRTAPSAPLFPLTPLWEAQLDDYIVSPLGADRRRVYVATRDGAVTALDRQSGAVTWRVEDLPGRLTVAPGRLILRGPDGTVRSLRPRTGEVRWSTETGIAGPLPVTLDADRMYVAGDGMASLDAESGTIVWSEQWPVEVTTPVVPTVARVIAGEADGTLRCRDRATGVSLWTHLTGGPLRAPPWWTRNAAGSTWAPPTVASSSSSWTTESVAGAGRSGQTSSPRGSCSPTGCSTPPSTRCCTA